TCGNFFQSTDCALVAFNDDDTARAECQECTCEASGSGTNLNDGRILERLGGPRDARGQIEIEQEVLAKGFFRREPVAADNLAQRRQVIDLRHYFAGTSAGADADNRPASARAATRLDGSAEPFPAISNAVP